MNPNHALPWLLVLSPALSAQDEPPASEGTMSRLSRSAETELAKSIQELNALREQIQTDKLPLNQELTASEEKLTTLRREYDRLTRLVDEGALASSALRTEMDARTAELTYVGNLLDEYVRSIESKVSFCELQRYGQAILVAKETTESKSITMSEKFAQQVEFVGSTVTRLFDAVGGMRFAGLGVDLQGSVMEGQFAVLGPVALFRSVTGTAGVVVPQTGSDKPLVRPLEGEAQEGLAKLVETGEGSMPLDPSRGGALKALIQKTNLIEIFEKGGPIMWPLLAASVLALGTVLERVLFLLSVRRRRDPRSLERLLAKVEAGDVEGAVASSRDSKDHVVRTLSYALAHREKSLSNALLYAQAQELKRFQRGVPILDTVITLAPLLGLLGTVTGMMGSFSLIGGELSAPGAITVGIAEALIATAFGLGIAITALLPFNFLNARADEARHEMESAATQLELLVQTSAAAGPPEGGRVHAHHQRELRDRDHVSQGSAEGGGNSNGDVRRKRLELRRQIAELQAELEDGLERGVHSGA
jgi:biopolymer transport protein ExbB